MLHLGKMQRENPRDEQKRTLVLYLSRKNCSLPSCGVCGCFHICSSFSHHTFHTALLWVSWCVDSNCSNTSPVRTFASLVGPMCLETYFRKCCAAGRNEQAGKIESCRFSPEMCSSALQLEPIEDEHQHLFERVCLVQTEEWLVHSQRPRGWTDSGAIQLN